jgi:DNA-binding transcriptional regulator YiaG
MKPLKPAEIKRTREGLGMSQAEFGRAFHLSARTLQQWEQGATTPSGPTAVLLWLISRIPQQIIKALRES